MGKKYGLVMTVLVLASSVFRAVAMCDCALKERQDKQLYVACIDNGDKEAAMTVLRAGADINEKISDCGLTVLHATVYNNNVPMMQFLLEQKADTEVQDNNEMSALHLAAWLGRTEQVKLLLAHKANIETRSANAQTPLHLAAGNNKAEVVRLLLAHRAHTDVEDNAGKTSLALAEAKRYPAVIRFLKNDATCPLL